MKTPPAWATRLGVIALLLIMWEGGARLFANPLFLCPPSKAVLAMGKVIGNPDVQRALATLAWELSLAFVISVVLGLAVGLLLGLSDVARNALMPIVILLYATPQITILPLIMLSVGIGPVSKVVFGVTHGVFPIVLTAAASLRNIKPVLMTTARSMGANPWQLLRYVLLPHMLPSFFTGLRLCLTAVLLGVLLAELFSSSNGIGLYARTFTESFDPPSLFALLAVLAAGIATLNELLRAAERRSSRWKST
jgi:ABC-type nitrate/sulfonate/bicarbonate transport system permease component